MPFELLSKLIKMENILFLYFRSLQSTGETDTQNSHYRCCRYHNRGICTMFCDYRGVFPRNGEGLIKNTRSVEIFNPV